MVKLIITKGVPRRKKKKGYFRGNLWIPKSMTTYVETERELMIEIYREFGVGDFLVQLPPTRFKRKISTLCRITIFSDPPGWIRTGGCGRFRPSGQVGQFNRF